MGGHLFDLLAQRLDLSILLVQQAFLFLDFPGVHRYLFGGDKVLVKGTLLIVRAIAVVNPLHKLKQTAQGSKRIARLNAALGMYRQIAQFDDKRHLAPGVGVNGEAEGRLMNEGLQIVLVGHFHGLVRRIDPLHRQLQRLAAAHRTHGRGRRIDFLGFHAGRSKEGIFAFFYKKKKIRHKNTPLKNTILRILYQNHSFESHILIISLKFAGRDCFSL